MMYILLSALALFFLIKWVRSSIGLISLKIILKDKGITLSKEKAEKYGKKAGAYIVSKFSQRPR